jgi:hypothetical protein
MRHNIRARLGLCVLLSTGACQAQVHYNDIQTGTLLDDKGIKIGAFMKPLPLPQGQWLVVSRADRALPLTGGREPAPTTSSVTLTLKSTDPQNGIAAMVVHFTPDSIPVRWMGNYCPNRHFSILDDLGTEPNGTTSACAEGHWFTQRSFQQLIAAAAAHPDKTVKTYFGGLTPYAKEMPHAYANINLSARRDLGRSLDYMVYARIPANFKFSGRFDAQTREWVRAAGKALLDTVRNSEGVIPAFPSGEDAALASPFPNEVTPQNPAPKPIPVFSGAQG